MRIGRVELYDAEGNLVFEADIREKKLVDIRTRIDVGTHSSR